MTMTRRTLSLLQVLLITLTIPAQVKGRKYDLSIHPFADGNCETPLPGAEKVEIMEPWEVNRFALAGNAMGSLQIKGDDRDKVIVGFYINATNRVKNPPLVVNTDADPPTARPLAKDDLWDMACPGRPVDDDLKFFHPNLLSPVPGSKLCYNNDLQLALPLNFAQFAIYSDDDCRDG